MPMDSRYNVSDLPLSVASGMATRRRAQASAALASEDPPSYSYLIEPGAVSTDELGQIVKWPGIMDLPASQNNNINPRNMAKEERRNSMEGSDR